MKYCHLGGRTFKLLQHFLYYLSSLSPEIRPDLLRTTSHDSLLNKLCYLSLTLCTHRHHQLMSLDTSIEYTSMFYYVLFYLSTLMFLKINWPPLNHFEPEKYVITWLRLVVIPPSTSRQGKKGRPLQSTIFTDCLCRVVVVMGVNRGRGDAIVYCPPPRILVCFNVKLLENFKSKQHYVLFHKTTNAGRL